jgi:hypothetical protein
MCAPSALTSRVPFFASLTHFCQAQREPSDNTIYVQERKVVVDVTRNRGRVNIEIWRADNEDVVYFNGDISNLDQLLWCSFSKSQVRAIRAKILACLPA